MKVKEFQELIAGVGARAKEQRKVEKVEQVRKIAVSLNKDIVYIIAFNSD